MLFQEIIAVYSENGTLCAQNIEFLKIGGAYNSHCALKG
jgi:hypothetical protein